MPALHAAQPPSFRSAGALRALLLIGVSAGLAACAETPVHVARDQGSVLQEAAGYRARAKHYYAPPGPASDPWGPYIQEASTRFDVPGTWIRAVMMQESGGRLFDRSGNFTTSIPGAMGLMQLMPPTYDDMRAQYSLGDDPYDPRDNIFAGTAYIRQMYDIYGSPGFLAAYNDGPGNLDAYLRRGRPLPRETRRYVASLGPQVAGVWPNNRSQADLMVAQHDSGEPAPVLVARNTPQANAVSAAWQQRGRSTDDSGDAADSNDAQPTQVAEAAAPAAAAPTPAYTRDWAAAPVGNGSGEASSVRAAWAARGVTAPRPPVQLAAARVPVESPAQDEDSDTAARPIPAAPTLATRPTLAQPASHRFSFHFITPAMAEPLPTIHHASEGKWAIQVGAYSSAAQAQSAVGQAHRSAGATLSNARAFVAPVSKGRAHLYRARLTGLSHEEAVAACHRLGGRSPCVVVSPNGS